ncbi:uncharacterized protein LOC129910464 [Episyrphus balteatus]|uniref:uncharacterized protein LOC129910464 n=1 Tax=Episyrphus balteatus TaxID=286459 RepID=UPI002485BE20|nr:uncharacterized protein LOC129910464 [Episyrphus balteatus]
MAMDNLKFKFIGVLREDNAVNMNNLAGILHCKRRLEWTREWLRKNQNQFTAKENILKEIQFRSNEIYHLNCFFDITEKQFRFLVNKLGPLITNYQPHRKKKFFSAEERLAITLKYLATGEFHSCRNYCFRASKPVILKMIGDICMNIYETLKDHFISTPKTEEEWKTISNAYYKKTRVPNCIGSLTMKHITFNKHPLKQSDGEDTLIFTGIVDSNDNFVYANVEPSPNNSEKIFESSTIKGLIEQDQMNLPKHPDTGPNYFFVGHGALPVKPYLLNTLKYVPYSSSESSTWFNYGSPEYKYCYAMDRVEYNSESALRMLTNIFPILSAPFRIDSENARKITLGCVALYNFLRKTERSFFKSSEKIKCEEECIVGDEEELKELEENSPNISDSMCLKVLRKQSGDDELADVGRKWLIEYFSDRKNQIF